MRGGILVGVEMLLLLLLPVILLFLLFEILRLTIYYYYYCTIAGYLFKLSGSRSFDGFLTGPAFERLFVTPVEDRSVLKGVPVADCFELEIPVAEVFA